MTVRYSRNGTDWALVIRALDIMGEDALVQRIRETCQSSGPTSLVAIDADGRDATALDLAVRMADEGRPSHFPPVRREVVQHTRPAGAGEGAER